MGNGPLDTDPRARGESSLCALYEYSFMSERSDETTTREPSSTDDLLEETERLLSGSEGGSDLRDPGKTPNVASAKSNQRDPSASSPVTERSSSKPATERSATSPATGRAESPSISERLTSYFSPKAFLGIVLAVGAVVTAGTLFLPLGGLLVGTLAAAFTIGLLTSNRRYLEMLLAGGTVGAVATLVDNAMLAVVGSGQTLLAIGAAVGLVSCVLGYYFGRDLRDGLSREI